MQRVWASGLGVFLLVLLVIAGAVSILAAPPPEERSTSPIFSVATPTPGAITATPTTTQTPTARR